MLSWFRRHAKVLMVVLGSAAMAIFGLGPVFDTLSQRGLSGSGQAEEVIAQWKGGKITRSDVRLLKERHFQSLRFLSGVAQQAFEQKGDDFRSYATPIQQVVDGEQDYVDEQLIGRFLMAEKAREEGVLVSDGLVNDYINTVSGEAGFTNQDLRQINKLANKGYCSLDSVKEHLKLELLYNQMSLYTNTGLFPNPNPTEAMEMFGRTSSRIECEVLPVDVKDYLPKITQEPDLADLKALYEKGKFDFKDPRGNEPGFKLPRMVKVQYFTANYETFLQNEINKLTDEEVQKEYDRLVTEKDNLVTEVVEEEDSIDINTPPPGNQLEIPETEGAQSTETPDDVTPPPVKREEISSNAAGDAADDKKPSDLPTENKEESSNPEDNQKQSSLLEIRGQKPSFVSTVNQEEEQKKDPSKTEFSKDESGNVQSGDDAAKTQDPTDSTPDKTEEQNKTEGGIGSIGDIEDAINQQDDAPQVPEVERRIKPLKDVVDELKRTMAGPAANKAMDDALNRAGVLVQAHFQLLLRVEAEKQQGKTPEQPAPLDFEKVAKDYNLTAQETELVDIDELALTEIGKVQIYRQQMVQGRVMPQFVRVAAVIFSGFNNIRFYEKDKVDDTWASQSKYLYWLVDKAEARTPTYDECKDNVLAFWKQQKAYELAYAEAEKIQKKANENRDKRLSELYPEKAFPTNSFSWFNSLGQLGLAEPVGVSDAGSKFMETAFGLAEMETGIAPNEPKEIIYAIQSLTGVPTNEETGTDFLEQQIFKFKKIPAEVQRVNGWYLREQNQNWNDEFVASMGLKWMNR
ncbi:MAG: hypothetical protein AAF939_10530 [Planctomycetota bacterium]